MKRFDPNKLNPGIRETVMWLRGQGFNTCDSGDGETHEFECDRPEPYVYMTTAREDLADDARLLLHRILRDFPTVDMSTFQIEASYSPIDGHAVLMLTNFKVPK